jgi:Fe-S cluster biogenesis protein NfuA
MGKKVELDNIQRILEEDVRPALMAHEGDVELISYKSQVVKVKLHGKCSGCPSAYLTTEELIAAKIKEKMPEVKDVVLVQEVNPELLDFARRILNHEI